jgi:hypothetical protein
MLSETVNPANGSLSLRIAVPAPPGRELTLPFSFAYDSNGLRIIQPGTSLGTSYTTFSQGVFAWGAWSYAIPQLGRVGVQFSLSQQAGDGSKNCNATTGYTFTDPSGTRHAFYLSHIYNFYLPGLPQTESSACITSRYQEFDTDATQDQRYQAALVGVTYGTSTSTMLPSTDGNPQMVDPDGTVYSFGNGWGCAPNSATNSGPPTSIEDRNGNVVNVSTSYGTNHTCVGPGSAISVGAVDSIGRALFSATGNGFEYGGTDTVTVAGLAQPYTVTWGSMGAGGISLSHQQVVTDSNCVFGTISQPWTGGPITEITLPNTQTTESYQLSYASGEYLGQIKYPTGGTVTYTWGANPLSAFVEYNDTLNRPYGCQYRYDTPAVVKRVVSFDGTNNALEQDFSYSTQWDATYPNTWDSKTTTITTRDLVHGTTSETVYTYYPAPAFGAPNMPSPTTAQVPFENTIASYDTSGALLKTVTKGFIEPFELACEIVQLPNTLIGGTFYTYGPGAMAIDKKEYDYGHLTSTSCTPPGTTADRETAITYQNFASTPIYTPSTPAPSIFDRACKAVIKDSTGTVAAETDYLYDGGSTTCSAAGTASVATANSPAQHDARYAYTVSPQPPRGNATKTTRQCFPSCSNQVTSYSYDETGQVVSMIDPKGNTTAYSYADNYSSCGGNPPPDGSTDAFITRVTYPQTNGVNHIVGFCYDYTTGLLHSSTDENNQTTSYKYADSLNRLTEVDYPDCQSGVCGQTLYTYNDAAPTPSVTAFTKVNSSGATVTNEAIMDGLMHTTHSELT